MKTIDSLAEKEYWGRMMLIGRYQNSMAPYNIVLYAVTGRSPSSRARELVHAEDLEFGAVKTNPTDPEQVKEGIEPLLIYNAIRVVNNVVIVSNGAQTDMVADWVRRNGDDNYYSASLILALAFDGPYMVDTGNEKMPRLDLASFEPDWPNYTPRITGLIRGNDAAFIIIKRGPDGRPMKQIFDVPLVDNKASFLATYEGTNVPSGAVIPSWVGEPLRLDLALEHFRISTIVTSHLSHKFQAALGPKEDNEFAKWESPGNDFRVGGAVLSYNTIDNTFAKPHIFGGKE